MIYDHGTVENGTVRGSKQCFRMTFLWIREWTRGTTSSRINEFTQMDGS